MRRNIVQQSLIVLLVIVFLVPMLWPVAQAQDTTTEPSPVPPTAPGSVPSATISDDAKPVLDAVIDAYSQLKSLSLEGKATIDFDVNQRKMNQTTTSTASFLAPNYFRHEVPGEYSAGSTGKEIYFHSTKGNVYMKTAAPEQKVTSNQLPQPLNNILQTEDPALLLATSADPRRELVEGASSVSLDPPVTIDGQSYQSLHLVMRNGPEMNLDIDPATHLVRRITFNLKPILEAQGAQDIKQAQAVIDYTKVDAQSELTADAFAWSVPEGARDIAEVQAEQQARAKDPSAASKEWEGKTAPDFTLADMDGKQVALKDLQGKTVLLDFWATWCGPCVVSMPHLIDTYNQKSAQGLMVFAVNIGEEKDQVQKFVNEKGWKLPILFDHDSSVAMAYGAEAIPYRVLIGKDGKVRKITIGAGESAMSDMDKAVEAALAE